jgi:hypothetical protein
LGAVCPTGIPDGDGPVTDGRGRDWPGLRG